MTHVGPGAGHALNDIPAQYDSVVLGALILAILPVLVIALFLHCYYELRRLFRARRD